MPQTLTARLVNPPFEDPGLLISFRWKNRAILFDLGRTERLSAATILKISDVFVSHTHMDHFIGFDHLLRLVLARDKLLRVYGPKGIIDNVRGKLAAYTWNLTDNYPLVIVVTELDGQTLHSVSLRASARFELQEEPRFSPFGGVLLAEDDFQVRAVILDHRIPCLGFSLVENERIHVRKDALNSLGLVAGPWLTKLKDLIRARASDDELISVGVQSDTVPVARIGDLRAELLHATEGMKISYVVDALFSESNQRKILDLATGSDLFFCETPFLDRDQDQATSRYHLTAAQAGYLARTAGVKGLIPFHFSPRYESTPEALFKEAMAEAEGDGRTMGTNSFHANPG
jgi:ribonuclease Z